MREIDTNEIRIQSFRIFLRPATAAAEAGMLVVPETMKNNWPECCCVICNGIKMHPCMKLCRFTTHNYLFKYLKDGFGIYYMLLFDPFL